MHGGAVGNPGRGDAGDCGDNGPVTSGSSRPWTVIVPVKSSARAKSRIRLDPAMRRALALIMAEDTVSSVTSAGPVGRTLVVVEDPRDGASLARMPGVEVFVTHTDELNAAIETWCARHDLADIQKTADAAGIGNSRYNLPSEVVAHPQLQARDRWRPVDTPNGQISALLPPPVITGFEQPMGAVPGLGEHTDAVLAELGLSDDDVAALRDQGAIGPSYP